MRTHPRAGRRQQRTRAWPPAGLAQALVLLVAAGCGTVKSSDTARTGTEQLLLTNAWDTALSKVDFRPLAGVPVFLDVTNVAAVDQGWVVSSLRESMLQQGLLLREKKEQAQWVVEARVGAYGTDANSWLLGIAQTTVPPTITGLPSGTIPEIPLIKKSNQYGVAKLALFAYDRASGHYIWRSGPLLAFSTAKDVHFLGIGPMSSGTIERQSKFLDMNVKFPGAGASSSGNAPAKMPPFSTAPELKQPSQISDLDGFTPGR